MSPQAFLGSAALPSCLLTKQWATVAALEWSLTKGEIAFIRSNRGALEMLTRTVSVSECPPSDLSFSSTLRAFLVHLLDSFHATLFLDLLSVF